MGFVQWAIDPWGLSVPIHIAWFLIWVAVIAGLLFFIVHATYLRYFAKPRQFAPEIPAPVPSEIPAQCAQTFGGGAHVPLGHGGLDVDAAVYGFSAQGWRSVSVGDLPLDRRCRADRIDPLSHLPRLVLAGLLVDLARPNRYEGRLPSEFCGLSGGRRRRPGSSPNIRWRTSSTTAPSSWLACPRSRPEC